MGCQRRLRGLLFWLILWGAGGNFFWSPVAWTGSGKIGLAVEFNNHAACAYVAREKGWFQKKGLELTSYESHKTGLALAASLARGDIQAAYICLPPALLCRGRGIPLKVVAGTHRYGYGLVVQEGISSIHDLRGMTIGCVREGSPVDLLLHRMNERYSLDSLQVRRMGPLKLVMALKSGRLDGAWLPEHHMTMARVAGLSVLLRSQDLWPGMQGSVLVVKEDLIRQRPRIVRALVEVTRDATLWLNQNPKQGAAIMGRVLQIPAKIARESMENLEYRSDIDRRSVQEIIDYMVSLGYLARRLQADSFIYNIESEESFK